MRNKNLNLQLNVLKEVMENWNNFRDIYRKIYTEKKFGPEEENAFLKTKEFLARHQYIVQELAKEYNIGEERMDMVLSSIISIDSIQETSDLQMKKIDNDWHITYLSINKILGILEAQHERLARTSAIVLCIKKLFLNPFLNLLMLIGVIIVLYIIAVNVFQLDKLLKPVP
jgi:HD-GYP domain-containing protein (c-di-GMP phosphodiesterase class II)